MEGATTSYASVQEEGPPTSSDFDAIGLFMPQRAGARRQCGPQHVIWMLWLLFVSAVALTVSVVGGMCFLDRGHACYFYISPLERAFARASFDSRVWWRLAESVIFTAGIVGFLRAAATSEASSASFTSDSSDDDASRRRHPRGSSSTGDSGVPGVTALVGVAAPDDATLRAGLPATGAAKSR